MGGFPCLEVLNLSYNGLSAEAVLALAEIPKLRQLDLSRNELTQLPRDMVGFKCLQAHAFLVSTSLQGHESDGKLNPPVSASVAGMLVQLQANETEVSPCVTVGTELRQQPIGFG